MAGSKAGAFYLYDDALARFVGRRHGTEAEAKAAARAYAKANGYNPRIVAV